MLLRLRSSPSQSRAGQSRAEQGIRTRVIARVAMWRLAVDWKQKCRVEMGLISLPNQPQHYDSKTGPRGVLKDIPSERILTV